MEGRYVREAVDIDGSWYEGVSYRNWVEGCGLDRNQWWAVVNIVMMLQAVLCKVESFFTNLELV
jgi:hypothetical protein